MDSPRPFPLGDMTAFPDVPHMELSQWQQCFLETRGASAQAVNIMMPDRPRIGKTVALMHLYLRRAWENPGEWVKVEDHWPTLDATSGLFNLVHATVVNAGLSKAMEFNWSHRSFRVSCPSSALPSPVTP